VYSKDNQISRFVVVVDVGVVVVTFAVYLAADVSVGFIV
jgi:hypothetical protein